MLGELTDCSPPLWERRAPARPLIDLAGLEPGAPKRKGKCSRRLVEANDRCAFPSVIRLIRVDLRALMSSAESVIPITISDSRNSALTLLQLHSQNRRFPIAADEHHELGTRIIFLDLGELRDGGRK
jgi:hypothetical protein